MTETNEEDRKKVVQKHREDLNETKEHLAKSKENVAKSIQLNREIYDSLDKTESKVDEGIKVNSELLKAELNNLSEKSWDGYQDIARRDSSFCTSVGSFYQDTTIIGEKTNEMALSAKWMETATCATSDLSFYHLKSDPAVNLRLTFLQKSDTVDGNAGFIKSELDSLCSDKVTPFEKIIMDWKTTDSEIKYTSLLALRSLIFYQLFDTFCQESKYSRSPWYSQRMKKRLCQAKYFMIGNTNEANLIQTAKLQINSTADDMQNNFDKLSEYGKHGKDQATTDSLFTAVLSDFVQCLQLRKIYHIS